MGYIAVSNTFTNGVGRIIDATAVNANFADIVLGLSNGSKDINVSAGSFASNVTITGNETLSGNFTMVGSDKTANFGTAVIGGHLKPKVTDAQDLGSDSLRWNDLYCKDGTMTSLAIGGEAISTNQLSVAGKVMIRDDVGIGNTPNSYGAYKFICYANKAGGTALFEGNNNSSIMVLQDHGGRDLVIGTNAAANRTDVEASNGDLLITTSSGTDMTVASTRILEISSFFDTYMTGSDVRVSNSLYAGTILTGSLGNCSISDSAVSLSPSGDSYISGVDTTIAPTTKLHLDTPWTKIQGDLGVGIEPDPDSYARMRVQAGASQNALEVFGIAGLATQKWTDNAGRILTLYSDTGTDSIILSSYNDRLQISADNGNEIAIAASSQLTLQGSYTTIRGNPIIMGGSSTEVNSTDNYIRGTGLTIDSSSLTIESASTYFGGPYITFTNLPTSDPGSSGQLWSNGGVLTISAGGGG